MEEDNKERKDMSTGSFIGLIFIVLILVGFIYGIVGSTKTDVSSNVAQDTKVQQVEDNKPVTEEEETKPAPVVVKKGERGQLGEYSTKVIKAESSPIEGGQRLTVHVDIKNVGKKPISVDRGYFQLVDAEDRTFEPSDYVDVTSNSFFMETINPGMSLSGSVVFDIPTDVEEAALAMRDNMFDFGGAEYVYFYLGELK